MAGGDADSRSRAVVPHCPAQSGGGLQTGVQVSSEPVGGNDLGGFQGEQVALDPAVVADGHFPRQLRCFQVGAQALGSPADDINVHPVGACADDAPQSSGAEFQIPVKPVIDGVCVLFRVQAGKLLVKLRVFLGPFQPKTVERLCTHFDYLLVFIYRLSKRQWDKLEFVEGKSGIEQHCHSEPVRTLV